MNTQERKIPKPHPHAALIKAWADGATIQSETTGGRWVDVPHPSWFPDLKYRIKPEEPWKPESGETYRFITSTGKVVLNTNQDEAQDINRIAVGNCFPDSEEGIKQALAAAERVRDALKSESAINVSELERSKTELDGMPLDFREKVLVRELRRGLSSEDLFVLFKQLSYGERM